MVLVMIGGGFLFQMGRRPLGLPEDLVSAGEEANFGEVLRSQVEAKEPRRFTVKEEVINGYLTKLRERFVGVGGEGMRSGIVRIRCEPRFGRIWVERWVLGVPIYLEAAYRLEFERDILRAQLEGGAVGRVRLPAFAAHWFEPAFEPVWEVLKEDVGRMRGMQAVVLERGGVTLITRGR